MTPTVVAVDVGGTFTDCVAWSEEDLRVVKVSTTTDQSDGVIEGATHLVPDRMATGLLHGSTIATNALLERKGARTVLITDAGFEDVIEIGSQDRPSLYDSFADRPEPLVPRMSRLGVGNELEDLAARVAELDPGSVAVCLAYSYDDPSREEEVAKLLAHSGLPLSLSSRVAPEFREFERTSTTVLNAYLTPRVTRYLSHLARRSRSMTEQVQVMRSSGGLMDIDQASGLPAALLLSGPAGGVVAAAEMGRIRGYGRVVAFDMGGTSSDVCRIEVGRPEVAYQRTVDGFVCRMPSVAVHTVGAGGGSIGWVDAGDSLRVGPHSAGSDPGPAGYGRGGTEATVTDAHIVLGSIHPSTRLGGSLALDRGKAETAVERLGEKAGLSLGAAAVGILEVADAHMERAIRAVSVEQGADPRVATLVAFGGAGGLHATHLARRLGIGRVAIPPHAGVLSALGLLMAPPRHDAARSVLIDPAGDLAGALDAVGRQASDSYLASHGVSPVTLSTSVDIRYRGQAHELSVPVRPGEGFTGAARAFHQLHTQINGFSRPDDPVEVVTVRAVAEGTALMGWDDLPGVEAGPMPSARSRQVNMSGAPLETSVWWRPDLPAGAELAGPAVIEDSVGTVLLRPGDRATVAHDGTIEVTL